MIASIPVRLLFVVLLTCIALSVQNTPSAKPNKNIDKRFIPSFGYSNLWTTKKPGFFRTLFATSYEQWADTKNTSNYIREQIDNNFLPENQPVTTSAPAVSNVSTTEPPYRITRSEFLRILRRNIKGINRLYDIEFRDAQRQSGKTYAAFKKNVSMEISKFL